MSTIGQSRATKLPVEIRGEDRFITWGYFKNKSGKIAKSPMDKTGGLFSYADAAKWLPISKAELEIDNTDLGLGISLGAGGLDIRELESQFCIYRIASGLLFSLWEGGIPGILTLYGKVIT